MSAPDLGALRALFKTANEYHFADVLSAGWSLLKDVERLRHKASECECTLRNPPFGEPQTSSRYWPPGKSCAYMTSLADAATATTAATVDGIPFPVANLTDQQWRDFLRDHDLADDTTLVLIDGRGRIKAVREDSGR